MINIAWIVLPGKNDGLIVFITVLPENTDMECSIINPDEFIKVLKAEKDTKVYSLDMEEMEDGEYKERATKFYNELHEVMQNESCK